MRFLWKSQLKRERGKLLVKDSAGKNKTTRRDRFQSHAERSSGRLAGIVFLWLIFLGTVGYLVLFSSYLTLGSWQVRGLTFIKEDAFREAVERVLGQKYFGLIPRNRFFLIQPRRLEDLLKDQYPLIRDVSVERGFPDTLTITIEERAAIVLWCSLESCFHILEDGSVTPVTDAYQREENQGRTYTLRDESNQPLSLGTGVFDNNFGALIISLKRVLQEDLGIETENTLTLSSRFANELRVKTKEGWEIYLSTRIPMETSLAALGLLLEKEILPGRTRELRYIDLRIENRVFYRYQNEAAEAEQSPQILSPSTAPTIEPAHTSSRKEKK